MPADEDQSRTTMQQLVAAAVLEQLTPVQKALADLRADVAGLQSQQKQATAHAVHAASTGASQRPGIPRARPRQDRWPSGKQPRADSAGLSQAEKMTARTAWKTPRSRLRRRGADACARRGST